MADMERMIKVSWLGRTGAKEVNVQEAERILEHAYDTGGLVVNGRTNEIICELNPDIDELLILPVLYGG